ncbi:hypothetical protein J2X46_000206 [Nocardioides sp. BE266]|uniref:hypothetical protein n=1 Tax=Nocardioides sp. BE266 TaxID=2817725 RepID=UPI00285D1F27|nr:hypothetical protein [Nocardioides sp. BE266]MDR7251234.1 hypothetical protein [Nocardioides sp. BE266]
MSTPDTMSAMEDRLRAALAARAELVRPEDLAPLAPVVPLRPRWQSPWVLLATAAVVLLILGVVFQGVTGRQRSDDVAPKPDAPQVTLPADVGRDWKTDDLSSTPRLDLDGDGIKEKVAFLAEPTKEHDGRIRLQTTLSSTGEESWGIAQLQSTIGTYTLDPIDADGDGDQELVLPYDDLQGGPDAPGHPLVFDLRDGLLVQLGVDQPELLQLGNVQVPGSETEFYDLVRNFSYGVEDGRLVSTRSVRSFARGNMTVLRPGTIVRDSWTWSLDEAGVLHPEPAGCLLETPDGRTTPCPDGARDGIPDLAPASTSTLGVGETADFTEGYRFSARIQPGDPILAVDGSDGRAMATVLDVPDPRLATVQPTAVFYDGASVVVTSASDPSRVEVLAQRGNFMPELDRAGDIPLENTADNRTWLAEDGTLLTATAAGDGTWELWQWQLVSGDRITALPWGPVCFDDVEDPSTGHAC